MQVKSLVARFVKEDILLQYTRVSFESNLFSVADYCIPEASGLSTFSVNAQFQTV